MRFVKALLPTTAVLAAFAVSAATPVKVSQQGLQFSVAELSVTKGQVVVFVNDDRTAHNITVKQLKIRLLESPESDSRFLRMKFWAPGKKVSA